MLKFVLLFLVLAAPATARDNGQWENSDPKIREWMQGLKRPDNPTMSCCGESDAYWCDDISVRKGKTYCKITDDRPDKPRGRPHIPLGTEFEIPNAKLKYDEGNPTGHSIIFVNPYGYVWCFVFGTGT